MAEPRKWRETTGRSTLAVAVLAIALLGGAPPAAQAGAGDLDRSFGDSGKVRTPVGDGALLGFARQADGRLLAIGGFGDDTTLVRYMPDGTLDPSFGTGGRVMPGDDRTNYDLIVQPDGKSVAVGGDSNVFRVARRHPDGSLDASFGSGGRVSTAFDGTAFASASSVSYLADGRLLVLGNFGSFLALARYLPDGSLDESFGSGGRVANRIRGNATARLASHVVLPDGKVVVLAYAVPVVTRDGQRVFLAMLRYNADGTRDRSFGRDGQAFVINGFDGARLDLTPDGKLLVVGGAKNAPVFTARFLPDGSRDRSYGNGGVTRASLPDGVVDIAGIARGPSGEIFFGGRLDPDHRPPEDPSDFVIARLTPRGTLDRSFGDGGRVLTAFGPAGDKEYVSDILLEPDGRLIAVGAVRCCKSSDAFLLARYHTERFSSVGKTPRRTRFRDLTTGLRVPLRCAATCRARVELRLDRSTARRLGLPTVVGTSSLELSGRAAATVKLSNAALRKLRARRPNELQLRVGFETAGRTAEQTRTRLSVIS